jgi:hypothetical protein
MPVEESRSSHDDEAPQRRDTGRDHGDDGLASAHGAGFVSILGSRRGEKIESSKNDAGERTYRIAK